MASLLSCKLNVTTLFFSGHVLFTYPFHTRAYPWSFARTFGLRKKLARYNGQEENVVSLD